jgi:Ser/Thr protein kinase RdoA (MazF antagonist)
LFAADAGVPDSLVDFLSGELNNLEQSAVVHSQAGTAIHGDAHKGNVVSTEKGLRWVDLDTFALGDPEVDLAPARVASQRFQVSAGAWEEFLGGYCRPFDEERLDHYSRLKQLTMTSWLATLWRIRPETRPELLHRIETFREEAEWHAM